MDIRTEKAKQFKLVGIKENTKSGFQVIPMCWDILHKRKEEIKNRTDFDFLVAVNDYSAFEKTNDGPPSFDYYAAAEVSSFDTVPENMAVKELPPFDYVVFSYKGKSQDSMEPIMNYIYSEWFPASSYTPNENAKFDLIRYGEAVDEDGNSIIECFIPIK
ncbi:MAG: GyrI-like domain-containing protein [Oscillospiraceae bacterium]|nr:GyrI-like domain-containing protein [Candidatus Ruminococcus equi]